jgi:hypothetical protein
VGRDPVRQQRVRGDELLASHAALLHDSGGVHHRRWACAAQGRVKSCVIAQIDSLEHLGAGQRGRHGWPGGAPHRCHRWEPRPDELLHKPVPSHARRAEHEDHLTHRWARP